MLLGLASILLFLFNGRIAGISGIMGKMLGRERRLTDLAFVAGLLAGPYLYAAAFGQLPTITIIAPWPLIIIAGLLVGFGTRMGSGCTSGHGICGIGRLSPRSIAATVVFMVTAVITVAVTHHVLGG
jgi:uncharacterized membrane protein YedE/YeeE